MNKEDFAGFFWAENNVAFPDFEYVIHLAEPRCMVKFRRDLSMFSTYEDFFESIAEVQWIDGKQHEPANLDEFYTNVWNYLCWEERILEDDLDEMERTDPLF